MNPQPAPQWGDILNQPHFVVTEAVAAAVETVANNPEWDDDDAMQWVDNVEVEVDV